MNPKDPASLKRLWDAVLHSRTQLRAFREKRTHAIGQFAGSNYGDQGANEDVPLGYIELAVQTYLQQLVGGAPRAYTATTNPQLKPGAADLKSALDRTAEKIHLEETMLDVVQDAMFGPGIVKVGISESERDSWWNGVGEPFVEWIDLDDWVQDMQAKRWADVSFMGHRYRLPLDEVKNNEAFDKDVRKRLQASQKLSTTEGGDVKAESIAYGAESEMPEYEDEIELWDLYLPREKLLVTLAADDEMSMPLRIVKWKGPRHGPFHFLGFSKVPSQLMPLPPVAVWMDLHELANDLYLKLGRQALEQKTIFPYRGGSPEDVQNIADAPDGTAPRVSGELGQEVSLGGPDQKNMGFFLGSRELTNEFQGNLDSLGGLGTSAETVGQEKMLSANASQRIIFMRRRIDRFLDGIFTSLAFYLYDDPTIDMPLSRPIKGTDETYDFNWNAQTRQGKPDLFQIAIEPESMMYRSAEGQMAKVMQILRELVAPAAPELLAANMQSILAMLAEKQLLPELADLFLNPAPEMPPGEGKGREARQSPTTTRNYNRHSTSNSGKAATDAKLMQALGAMGGESPQGVS